MGQAFSFSGCVAVLMATAALVAPAQAYDLSPLVVQLDPSGPGAAGSVLITNSHTVPIAIEIKLYQRLQQPDGSDVLTPEKGDIVVVPPQMVIAPGASQSVRVQWTGDPKPEQELAFRLITEQLPIDLNRKAAGDRTFDVKVQYRYEAALYVAPPGAKPSANVTAASFVKEADGKATLELHVANSGNRRAILNQPTLELAAGAGAAKVTLSGASAGALNNLNILAGATRVVRLPWPEGLPQGAVTARLQSDYTIIG